MNTLYMGMWVNDDPTVKEFVRLAKEYYRGSMKFEKTGKKFYTAKLDPTKFKIKMDASETYIDLDRSKSVVSFYLRTIDRYNNTTITKITRSHY